MYGCLSLVFVSALLAQNLQPTPLAPISVEDAQPVNETQAESTPRYDWEEDITPSWQDDSQPAPRYEWEDTTPPADAEPPRREDPPAPPPAAAPVQEQPREVQPQAAPPAPAPEERPQPQRRVAAFWLIVPGL